LKEGREREIEKTKKKNLERLFGAAAGQRKRCYEGERCAFVIGGPKMSAGFHSSLLDIII
jgi:hypothetical protein